MHRKRGQERPKPVLLPPVGINCTVQCENEDFEKAVIFFSFSGESKGGTDVPIEARIQETRGVVHVSNGQKYSLAKNNAAPITGSLPWHFPSCIERAVENEE